MAMAGGFGVEKPADDEIRAVIETDTVRATVSGILGVAVATLTVVSYQTQVVRALGTSWSMCARMPASAVATD